jgi:hypothetical protein
MNRRKIIVEKRHVRGVLHQLEMIRCGKQCRSCPHGPYWYSYRWVRGQKGGRSAAGRWVSAYVGKQL